MHLDLTTENTFKVKGLGRKETEMKRVFQSIFGLVAVISVSLAVAFGVNVVKAQETGLQLLITTDRQKGICNYQVNGLNEEATLQATYINTSGVEVVAMEKKISPEGAVGSFSMDDIDSFVYHQYTVKCIAGDKTVVGDHTCDFSIKSQLLDFKVSGATTSKNRSATLTVTKGNEVAFPGEKNKVSLYVWKKSNGEKTANMISDEKTFKNADLSWSIDIQNDKLSFGEYYAKVMVGYGEMRALVSKQLFTVDAKVGTVKVVKNSTLEKKASFSVKVSDITSPCNIQKVMVCIFDKNGKKVCEKKTTKNSSGVYSATVAMSDLSNVLGNYTVKAKIVNGVNEVLAKTSAKVTQTVSYTKYAVTKSKKTRKSTFTLKGLYVPGNAKAVKYFVYYYKDGSFRLQNKAKAKYNSKKKAYIVSQLNRYPGKYKIDAYVTTKWGTQELVVSTKVKVTKDEAAKNGWYYEKYNGKKYKFYYIDNVKQTDLTDILGLQESSATNVNKFYIELNRAACTLTVYAYDSKTEKYIIPVKAFAVSVGRDTWTNKGAGDLNEDTSYTPIGSFSICSNGAGVKYTMKQMLEPDGSTCYARWASHVVGNVYFHSIAVSADSHYALRASDYNKLGSPASAGCVRMMVADAKWIYDYASVGSSVKFTVGNSSKPGPLGKPKTIKIAGSINYDPTDPGVPNKRKIKDYKAGLISGYMTKSGKKVGY
jgi:lipoprotein-anchoring transpeptidase ErfK/SrfK